MKNILVLFLVCSFFQLQAQQTATLTGNIKAQGEAVPLATIRISDSELGTVANIDGFFKLERLPFGTHTVEISAVGYELKTETISLTAEQSNFHIDVEMKATQIALDEVVITGTRTFKRKTDSPVIVNVVSSQVLEDVQACTLSEGLKFQPGLRVETDCQTCNYTQLRMNGLGGGYSQILINGRPIFSPLTGLYGMEQIPANMIDRIEVVRGGGSALYGSSAVGGTVNVITKIPKKNSYDVAYTFQSINGEASDNILNGNANVISENGKTGLSIFVNHRNREAYDHNGDHFSELPELRNNSLGANFFFMPTEEQKLELSFSSLQEYRYGGEITDEVAHLAEQSEERDHQVYLGSVDYQINFNNNNSSIIVYLAGQYTDRTHYTGILPDEEDELQQHYETPPYGTSDNTTLQAGTQINHRLKMLSGENVFTLGAEYLYDDVLDVIPAYNYEVDQLTKNTGIFAQSDWNLMPRLNLLSGLRADWHNLLDKAVVSPRVSLLYKWPENTQLRLTWGKGFRAPQAFDTDLHIAFAGGGISRVTLDDELREERSNSLSGSINYDKATEHWVAGFTLEGFYTRLENAFFLHPLGEDTFGEVFEKRNGAGSIVKGGTLEIRANYDQKIQLEAGLTLQSSLFKEDVTYIENLEPSKKFLRTPNEYGYARLSLFPQNRFNASINWVYTGAMDIVHFAGAPEQAEDEYLTTTDFWETSIRAAYSIPFLSQGNYLEFFGGIKNITNAYQNDFDSGKNRDSNYVYGPSLPRTYFVGIGLKVN